MHAALASSLGSLTWEKPSYSEFQDLARYINPLCKICHNSIIPLNRFLLFVYHKSTKILHYVGLRVVISVYFHQ